MRTRWSAYAGVSVALAGGVVVKALAQRPNFYSAAVYLSQSSANLMILTNMVFVVACSMLLGLQKLLYGPLRPIEIEQLYEKAWFAVTETCLAMTIFRGEIGAWFLVMFFALLAGKVWAWIGEGRVEVLEQQPPRNPRLFHTRLALSLGLSVCFDLTMLEYVVKEVMHMARPDMMVMFGFEFAVLSLVSLSTAARYAINLVEIGIIRKQKAKRVEEIRKERMETATRAAEQRLQQATADSQTTPVAQGTSGAEAVSSSSPEERLAAATDAMNTILAAGNQPIDEAELEVEGWEGKGRWIFYLDLTTDFFKLVVYLSFFFILLIFYGLPIHILRDVFMTCRSFFKRISDFMRYRTATRDMNDRYPDATEQEIGREDICIICREEMRPYQPAVEGRQTNPVAERMRPKKLPCGHILHFSCLRSWLERQQICPTCRTSVVPTRQTGVGQPNTPAAQGAEGQHGNVGAGGARGGGNNRAAARVFRIGPLRIGVGAARGNNMLEDLHNRLGDQEPREGAAADGNGGQQFGFGIRWDGMRRRERERRGRRPVQDQLDSAERQIQRELNSLGGSLAELQVLRNMESELSRLRALRQTASTRSASPRTDLTVTALTGDRQHILQAGNENLPAGLVLPEGWSMMPLQPLQGPLPHIPMQPPPPQAMPLPLHIPPSAMFTMPGQALHNNQAFAQPGPNASPASTTTQPQNASSPINSPPATQSQSSSAAGALNPSAGGVQDIARTMAEAMAEHTRNVHAHAQGVNPPTLGSHGQSQQPASAMASAHETAGGTHTMPSTSTSAPAATDDRQASVENSVPMLPVWGSGATATHNTTPPVSTSQEGVQTNGDTVHEASHTANRESVEVLDAESSSSSKNRTATVEDLVEDPD